MSTTREHGEVVGVDGPAGADPGAARAAPDREPAIQAILRRATDVTTDAWAVFEAVRDAGGALVDLRVLYGNGAYWELSGFDADRVLGQPLRDVLPAIDWRRGVAGRMFRALETGEDLLDRRVPTVPQSGPLAGQQRVFELEFTVDGELLSAGFRDITDADAAADRERRAFARFEAIFEQTPIPMILAATDRTFRLNEAALRLFARPMDELMAHAFQPDAPWIPADLRDRWDAMRGMLTRGERVDAYAFAIVRPDGDRREVEGTAIPIATRDGAPAGVVMVLTDLTERVALESQLRHSQKMEALGRLAGGIAHDFNNILMAILGYSEILAADARAGRAQAADAEQVVAATHRAVDLTARLTTFARREAARRESTEVAALIDGILPLVRRLAPESVVIDADLEPAAAVILDANEFEQVIVNLVVNAVDAMPTGGKLTIESREVELESEATTVHLGRGTGRHVLVAITDTGVGMDASVRSRIFEPFFTTKGVGEGTGLGLALVFAAVERAGGTIWVYSEPGHGTTFKIYLPVADAPAATARRGETHARPQGGSETILLVEDDTLVRDLVTRVLREYGYTVRVAESPERALAMATEATPDLLVTDVVMPGLTGDQLAARLRSQHPDLPVVFMSGYTARGLAFELGPADALVHKPMAPDSLARTVRTSLDRARR